MAKAKSSDIQEFPDIRAEYQRYAELNPEFRTPLSARASIMLRSIFSDKEGHFLDARQIARNVELFRIRIKAIIPQLEEHSVWQEILAFVNSRAIAGVAEPRFAALPQGSPDSSKMSEIKQPYNHTALRVASSDEDFRNSHRTLLKTYQEILTSPTERLAYSRDDVDSGHLDFSHVVIDPSCITPSLIDNLGLENYKPPKRSSKVRKVSAYAEAIPAIREMLHDLEPFRLSDEQKKSGLHYFRLMRIGSGKNEGYLLGTQHINGKKILFKTDVHGAHRRINHIGEGYNNEIATLMRIIFTIRDIDWRVANSWQQVKESEELQELQKELTGLVDTLQFVNNKHKVKMKKLIAGCVSMKSDRKIPQKMARAQDGKPYVRRPAETRAVFNPGAMRAKWNTVKDYVGKRMKEMVAIRRHLAEDQTRIQEYLQVQEVPFEHFYRTVEGLHQRFKLFDENHPLTRDDAEKITRNLLRVKAECQPDRQGIGGTAAFFEPYLTFSRKMVEHIDATVALLGEEHMDRAKTAGEFLKIYLVTKIQNFFRELQEFYERHLSPEKIPYFSEVLKEIEDLNVLISQKRINEQVGGQLIKTGEYDAVFGEIYHLLNSLRKKARLGEEALLKEDTDEARKIKKLMHDQVSNFRFDELLKKMKPPVPEDSTVQDSPDATG